MGRTVNLTIDEDKLPLFNNLLRRAAREVTQGPGITVDDSRDSVVISADLSSVVSSGLSTRSSGVIPFRNNTGQNLQVGHIIGVEGFTHTDEVINATRRTIEARIPQEEDREYFGVVTTRTADGEIGRAMFTGVTIVRFDESEDMPEPGDSVGIVEGEYEFLGPSGSNIATVLWSGQVGPDDNVYVLVRLGGSKGGLIPVQLEWTGGEDGDSNSPATYIYDIYSLNDEIGIDDPLASGLSPEESRPPGGMTDGDGKIGLAYQDEEGSWQLFNANERPRTRACNPPE